MVDGVFALGRDSDSAMRTCANSFQPLSLSRWCSLISFATGRGSKPTPSIKLASNCALFERLREDMVINRNGILERKYSIAECGEMIFQRILAIACGEASASEELNYGDNALVPLAYRHGDLNHIRARLVNTATEAPRDSSTE